MNWDYLIITASNDAQAAAYQDQLDLRSSLGLLPSVRRVCVIPDPDGRRIGSGGSTLHCLAEVLRRELKDKTSDEPQTWRRILSNLRILIIHAGGDSQRLPAYGPCGKIFVPIPDQGDSCLPQTLFDRQVERYLALPRPEDGKGQVVITSGDVLLDFDPASAGFSGEGITGLGAPATPEQALGHGVFCRGRNNRVRLFLQKPPVQLQQEKGAVDLFGRSLVDSGIMNFGADTAVSLLKTFGLKADPAGNMAFSGELFSAMHEYGLDFYRELCCAMGTDATAENYLAFVRQSGSHWPEDLLERLFKAFHAIPFYFKALPRLELLHFGTSRQIISSAIAHCQRLRGVSSMIRMLDINNVIEENAQTRGSHLWLEGCRIGADLDCGGENLIIGLDVERPLKLPAGMCLDIVKGHDPQHDETGYFVRCYGIDDNFKQKRQDNALFCNKPIDEWLDAMGAEPGDLWPSGEAQTLWNAEIFPFVPDQRQAVDWLWLFDPAGASDDHRRQWRQARRYSTAQIARLADLETFHKRRIAIRIELLQRSIQQLFRRESEFSAAELGYILRNAANRTAWWIELFKHACRYYDHTDTTMLDSLVFPRMLHSLASATESLPQKSDVTITDLFPGLVESLEQPVARWLSSAGLDLDHDKTVASWCQRAKSLAFESIGQTIIHSRKHSDKTPKNILRDDEIVWGRAPARLDTGGGWTDTPPYSLEWGGSVVNFAVDLNGQPPIQAYARKIKMPVIRISSIDLGATIEINRLDDLLDYSHSDAGFGLVKAALALSAFHPDAADWRGCSTLEQMLDAFGGGLDLTTLAAIPKGSGLGTSSIMAAAVIAVIRRAMGQTLTQSQLSYEVLRLEQALTTGGGWQDQIGGAVGGAKLITTGPGMVPEARIHFLPADIMEPRHNNGQTLLYYTGVTRLAKNILEHVVGRYLDRNRQTMTTLRQIRSCSQQVAECLSQKDITGFGDLVNIAWELNKELDPDSTNERIETIIQRVQPYIHGCKLLGAGGGGFLLMVCKSPRDAQAVKQMLNDSPPNEKARFFDYSINQDGLVVTVC